MNELNIKTSNESYFDYCERTEQMSIEWGKDVWDYLVPQLNNWIDTARLCENDSSYYRKKLIEIGKMLGEEVYICDDGTKSQDVLIEKIKVVLEKVIYQNKEVKEEENIWRKIGGDGIVSNNDWSKQQDRERIYNDRIDSLVAENRSLRQEIRELKKTVLFESKKEKRIPALYKKGTILRTVSSDPFHIKHIMRVNDDSENGFTDYDITHYDLEVLILDSSAEFVQTDKGNFLDYTKEAMEIS